MFERELERFVVLLGDDVRLLHRDVDDEAK